MTYNEKIISERIKQSLEDNNMTRKQLCDRVGMDAGQLGHYLNNKRVPTVSVIYRLAQGLDVSPAWLAGFSDTK